MISGIVLAAGAGTRRGGPKALVPGWLDAATRLLLDAGCERVVVVLGAGADEARSLVPPDPRIEVRTAGRLGRRHGRVAAGGTRARHRRRGPHHARRPAGHPGHRRRAPARLERRSADAGPRRPRDTLRQATYDGRPGHPVLVGANHWQPLSDALRGDRGARPYLVGARRDRGRVRRPAPRSRRGHLTRPSLWARLERGQRQLATPSRRGGGHPRPQLAGARRRPAATSTAPPR